jgi:hypothetical protein
MNIESVAKVVNQLLKSSEFNNWLCGRGVTDPDLTSLMMQEALLPLQRPDFDLSRVSNIHGWIKTNVRNAVDRYKMDVRKFKVDVRNKTAHQIVRELEDVREQRKASALESMLNEKSWTRKDETVRCCSEGERTGSASSANSSGSSSSSSSGVSGGSGGSGVSPSKHEHQDGDDEEGYTRVPVRHKRPNTYNGPIFVNNSKKSSGSGISNRSRSHTSPRSW